MSSHGLLALGGHQVEDLADRVQPLRGTDMLGAGVAGVRGLELEARPLQERVPRRRLAVVDRRGACIRPRARAREASSRASKPAGDRSVSSWSWPATPKSVAAVGSRAA